jgi:hypothetical protein
MWPIEIYWFPSLVQNAFQHNHSTNHVNETKETTMGKRAVRASRILETQGAVKLPSRIRMMTTFVKKYTLFRCHDIQSKVAYAAA